MSGPSIPFDAVPVPGELPAPICPQCRSTDLLALGRVFANSSGVRGFYRCRRCTTETWLRTTDRRGLPIAGRRSDEPPQSDMDLTEGTGVPMTNPLRWHSTLATDRPLYHDDTRCPEGGAVTLQDRRLGDGGRDPCEHCAGLLIQSIDGCRRRGIQGLLRVRVIRLWLGVTLSQVHTHLVAASGNRRQSDRGDGFDGWHAIHAGASAEVFLTFQDLLASTASR